jgi:hypothetical protein
MKMREPEDLHKIELHHGRLERQQTILTAKTCCGYLPQLFVVLICSFILKGIF